MADLLNILNLCLPLKQPLSKLYSFCSLYFSPARGGSINNLQTLLSSLTIVPGECGHRSWHSVSVMPAQTKAL